MKVILLWIKTKTFIGLSIVPKKWGLYRSLTRETRKKTVNSFSKLRFLNYKIYKKIHLATWQLCKIIGWSILASQSRSFSKLLSFFYVSFSGGIILEKIFKKYFRYKSMNLESFNFVIIKKKKKESGGLA